MKDARAMKIKIGIMIGALVLIIVGGIVDSKTDYTSSVEQQRDNNMQYFFGGKVIVVEDEYLILEIFDIGNTNLSEGAKVEVLTDIVAAKGCPDFVVDEYARVVMARSPEDNPPGRLEALDIYKLDKNGSPIAK